MSEIVVAGIGAVSPAGWGVTALREALARGEPIPPAKLTRPGWDVSLRARRVPPPEPRPSFLAHARLRRTSPIAHFAVGAALEALGAETPLASTGARRLGIILCVMTGCVVYSRRFYEEVWKDPATASPLVFPETVFNSPASHLAALLGTSAINYTLVGDPGTFLQGLALAADWLATGRVEGCLVVGTEEGDWLLADAFRHFARSVILGEGAGAVYLRRDSGGESAVRLDAITSPQLFLPNQPRAQAAQQMRAELNACAPDDLLVEGTQDCPRYDAAELAAWRDWTGPRVAPKRLLGEGLSAASAWQCVLAIDALQRGRARAAIVSVVGCNQQAIGARFRI